MVGFHVTWGCCKTGHKISIPSEVLDCRICANEMNQYFYGMDMHTHNHVMNKKILFESNHV